MEPVLSDNEAASRFEIHVDGERAGLVEYHRRGRESITLIHTEVDDRFQGQGIAGRLARFALDTAREEGRAVVPSCPYIRQWITKHPEYLDLVPEDHRAQAGD